MTLPTRRSRIADRRRAIAGVHVSGRTGYAIVLLLIVASYALCAAQQTSDPSPVAFLVMLVTVAVVFRVTAARPLVQHVAWVVLSMAAAATVIATLSGAGGHMLDLLFAVASMCALLIAPVAIIGHQVKRRGLNLEALLAAIAAYVLVGLFFTFVFNLLSLLSVEPAFDAPGADTLSGQLFFSFTTLTTTGYGNIVPASATAQGVAVAEAITGQLFLITAVARIMRGAGGRTAAPDPSPAAREPS